MHQFEAQDPDASAYLSREIIAKLNSEMTVIEAAIDKASQSAVALISALSFSLAREGG
jgi:hypothetical protein